ncbi:MAG: hypothetical protein ACYC0B_02200 [Gemmatimonadaceae bacterium]
MTMPFYVTSNEPSDITLFLARHWEASDKRAGAAPLDSAEAIARWQELQARAREDRLYYIAKRAVFVGTIKAHVILALIFGVLGAVAMKVVQSGM